MITKMGYDDRAVNDTALDKYYEKVRIKVQMFEKCSISTLFYIDSDILSSELMRLP